ncbi:MAG: GNAT family N-acetyltransferase [Deltaproteobacteria bacterium]|nr:GNAT family N-acetyltransferase [Candidatus Anaeroferrophillacea bacterium]
MPFFQGPAAGSQEWADSRRAAYGQLEGISFRSDIVAADISRVQRLVEATGFFHADEVAIAAELVAERLHRGDASGYHFIMADYHGQLVGYACFGPIPCTKTSYDLYWIAVHPNFQGRGLGRQLLQAAEHRVQQLGGTRVYVDTSSREQYAATRSFYERCGYHREAMLADFYAAGDGKVIYCREMNVLCPGTRSHCLCP